METQLVYYVEYSKDSNKIVGCYHSAKRAFRIAHELSKGSSCGFIVESIRIPKDETYLHGYWSQRKTKWNLMFLGSIYEMHAIYYDAQKRGVQKTHHRVGCWKIE